MSSIHEIKWVTALDKSATLFAVLWQSVHIPTPHPHTTPTPHTPHPHTYTPTHSPRHHGVSAGGSSSPSLLLPMSDVAPVPAATRPTSHSTSHCTRGGAGVERGVIGFSFGRVVAAHPLFFVMESLCSHFMARGLLSKRCRNTSQQ